MEFKRDAAKWNQEIEDINRSTFERARESVVSVGETRSDVHFGSFPMLRFRAPRTFNPLLWWKNCRNLIARRKDRTTLSNWGTGNRRFAIADFRFSSVGFHLIEF